MGRWPIYLLIFLMYSPRLELGTLAGYMPYRTEQEVRELCIQNSDSIAQGHVRPHKIHLYEV